jgi:hypothetical protein
MLGGMGEKALNSRWIRSTCPAFPHRCAPARAGFGRAHGQVAHLLGHHDKNQAPASPASAVHRGFQDQQVGLEKPGSAADFKMRLLRPPASPICTKAWDRSSRALRA